jgi:hypothetical protein
MKLKTLEQTYYYFPNFLIEQSLMVLKWLHFVQSTRLKKENIFHYKKLYLIKMLLMIFGELLRNPPDVGELHNNFSTNDSWTYFTIRGGSLKKIEKKIIPKVPTNKNV